MSYVLLFYVEKSVVALGLVYFHYILAKLQVLYKIKLQAIFIFNNGQRLLYPTIHNKYNIAAT